MKAIIEAIGGLFEPMADDMTSTKHHIEQIERSTPWAMRCFDTTEREIAAGAISPARPMAFVSPLEMPADREVLYVGLGDKLAVVEIERPMGHGTDVPLPADAFDVKMISL